MPKPAVSPLAGLFHYDATHLDLLRSLPKPAQVFLKPVPHDMTLGSDHSRRLYEDCNKKVVHAA